MAEDKAEKIIRKMKKIISEYSEEGYAEKKNISPYRLVNVNVENDLYDRLKKVVLNNYRYTNISNFIRCSIVEKMDSEKSNNERSAFRSERTEAIIEYSDEEKRLRELFK